jgi:hypothetical protein
MRLSLTATHSKSMGNVFTCRVSTRPSLPNSVAVTTACNRAANALDEHIAGRPVSCEEVGRDQYGRTVAVC